jgi:outer membrane protein TolC
MGLWGQDADYILPNQLSNLPAQLPPTEQFEAEAIKTRVDLIAARLELDAMAKSLGLTDATRFVSVLELAGIANYVRTSDSDHTEKAYPSGFELEVQIPIFDVGKTGVRRSREMYMQAVNRLVEKAVNVRSEVRAAYFTYRATYDISRQFRNRILPLRKSINEQAQLEYNGMLIDVFSLLTTVRESIASNVAAIAAKRDFFVAAVNFQSSIIGGGSPVSVTESPAGAASAQGGAH